MNDILPPQPNKPPTFWRVLVVLLLILNAAATLAAWRAPRVQNPTLPRWEYGVQFIPDTERNANERLNRLGDEGWEIFSVSRANAGDVDAPRWGLQVFVRRQLLRAAVIE